MRIFLISLFLLSLDALASETSRIYFDESISFESYLNENSRLKANYQCDFNKHQNRYFEFIFAVLTIETKEENETINSQIIVVAWCGGVVWWRGVVAWWRGVVAWWRGVVAWCGGVVWCGGYFKTILFHFFKSIVSHVFEAV